ncbi:unnamed protein product [Phytophthora fragariaefolia]|uniref:Unnamed protein product n=1 Tax=Phytophthora fragariaefolia TaxID=1490495 RepID=A0A9W6Y0V3_9STRA|nr:unnamed protein product [Phytophthora fragariaefolia]
MTGSESTREGGRSAYEGTRRSRRTQGIPPEEQSSLEEVERTARRRNAARRRAAREEKESTEDQDQLDSEPAIQEAHQAILDTGTRDGLVEEPPKGSERDSVSESLGVSNTDVPTSVSVGDAVKVEPPVVDATSEASPLVQDVVTLEDNSNEESIQLTLKDEGPLPAVEEESVPANSNDALWLRSELASPRLIQEDTQGPSPEVPDTSASRVVVDLTEVADPDAQVHIGEMTVAQAKAYLADYVRRWERVTLEFVASPTIEFRNLIPGWFQARASQVDSSFVRAITQDLQQLLAVELLEWSHLASGVSSRIVPARSVQASGDDVKFEESGMDVAMTDYEAGPLGRDCLHRMRMAGVRPTRSPVSSALGKPEPKRPQYDPPRPLSIPSLSSRMSFWSSAQAIQDADSSSDRMSVSRSVASRRTQNRESCLFGTTIADSDESNFSGVLGSRSPGKYSSSLSSIWSFGGALAGAHMSYAGATGMVMTVQGAAFQDASPVGVQVTETILPESSGVITGCSSERRDRPISDLPAAQLQATLPTLTGLKYMKEEARPEIAKVSAS